MFTRLQTVFNSILTKTTHEIEKTSSFFHHFCETQTIDKDSVEKLLFTHLKSQDRYYVHADDEGFAKEVFGTSRDVSGVVCPKLLQILYSPEPNPTRSTIVNTAIKMLCVEDSIWQRPLSGDGWDVIERTFSGKVPRAYMLPVPNKFISHSNRWIQIENEKCLVLSRDSECHLTAQDFYLKIIEHDDIRPLVSDQFWTLLTRPPRSPECDLLIIDDSDDSVSGLTSPVFTQQSTVPNVQAAGNAAGPRAHHHAAPALPAAPAQAPKQTSHPALSPTVTSLSNAKKRTQQERDSVDQNDVMTTSGRQLKVRVCKTHFDEVCISVEAGVRFEACVDP